MTFTSAEKKFKVFSFSVTPCEDTNHQNVTTLEKKIEYINRLLALLVNDDAVSNKNDLNCLNMWGKNILYEQKWVKCRWLIRSGW